MRCEPDATEAVLAELCALAPSGFEQIDGDGFVEFAIYGAEGEVPELGELEAELAGGSVTVSSRQVEDGWESRWREFHRAVDVPGGIRVRPPWEASAPPARGAGIELVIEPGGAFGTGAHATTRLCLELLAARAAELAPRRRSGLGSLADWGTGSGVLAIAASRLGFSTVHAVDSEQSALEAAARNADANGAAVVLERADLRQQPPAPAENAVANLTAPLLLGVAACLGERQPGWIAISGVLNEEADAVSSAFAAAGLGERRRLTDGAWTALELARAAAS